MNEPLNSYEGWTINPAYLTPAYMGQFRPAYKENKMSLKEKALRLAKGNDGEVEKGEANKFHKNMKDMKDDGKLNRSELAAKARK